MMNPSENLILLKNNIKLLFFSHTSVFLVEQGESAERTLF